ncbi:MAG: TetR/AcrR family transcriptional regulator [Bacteroidales bacterium]|jgi:AcrR family transcriptional regulator|nr:TetR/AcrR family transcriptional regulator [Bacteroidales bacterium]
MKTNLKTKQKEATRKKIMEVSLDLFSRQGYEAVSMAKVAKGVEISKGNLYNYFESKEQMLSEIVLNAVEEIYRDFDSNHDGEISHEEFLKFIDDVFVNMQQNRKFWKLVFSLLLQPNMLEIVEEKLSGLSKDIFGLFYTYFNKENPKDPVTEMVFFSSLLKGTMMQYVFAPESFDIDKLKHKIKLYYSNHCHQK